MSNNRMVSRLAVWSTLLSDSFFQCACWSLVIRAISNLPLPSFFAAGLWQWRYQPILINLLIFVKGFFCGALVSIGSFRVVVSRHFNTLFQWPFHVLLVYDGFKTISPHWWNNQGGKSWHVSGIKIGFWRSFIIMPWSAIDIAKSRVQPLWSDLPGMPGARHLLP